MDLITLQLTPQQMDYIAQVLAQRPWHEVNPLLVAIQTQITRQQQPQIPFPGPVPNGEDSHAP